MSIGILISDSLKLGFARAVIGIQNVSLELARVILFKKNISPKNILIFKIGNIGDVTCAIPSFIAIRRAYPEARITLLTSLGSRGGIGAGNFISGAWYFDSIKNYYSEDIATWSLRKKMVADLRRGKFDFFIQISDDWASWKTLFRNLIFAKLIGVRVAIGFKTRTILAVFRKVQIDSVLRQNEAEFQLALLSRAGIKNNKVEFNFPISEKIERETKQFIADNLGGGTIIGICPGGKDESKRWPAERFGEVAKKLLDTGAKIIIFGGGSADRKSAEEIVKMCGNSGMIFNATARVSIHEQIVALKSCKFLLTNDTGPMHLAAAVGTKVVALFSIRNLMGTWFPYGEGHKILYKRNLPCDYGNEACIRRSLEEISVGEVIAAYEELLNQ